MTNLMLFDNAQLSFKEAAELLGVSGATVTNWVKLGVLPLSENVSKKRIDKSFILKFKEKIISGKSEKLKSRANKVHVNKRRIHKEINDPNLEQFLSKVDEITSGDNYESILISLAIDLLKINSINTINKSNKWVELCNSEIDLWKSDVKNFRKYDIEIPENACGILDILGKTYQHISESHAKAIGGVFYTPEAISKKIVNDNLRKEGVFLDPCCGSGSFLIQALLKKIKDKDEIIYPCLYGFDVDPIAVHICRINLLILGRDSFEQMPKVNVKNILESIKNEEKILGYKVDLIATNPPWGANLTASQKELFCGSDSFSLFLRMAIDSTRVFGKIAFLLPESFIDVSAHSAIRKKIISEASDITLTKLGKAFAGMLTNVVLLEAKVGGVKPNQIVTLRSEIAKTNVTSEELLSSKFSEFVFNIDNQKQRVIDKIYSFKHKLLSSESDYSLGIVTGNNAKLVLDKKVDGAEGILKGKDIQPFKFNEPTSFITFDRASFQQCSDESYFRADEKLIYRFISNKLIFSYDNKKTLTLNSANFIIPKVGIPVKVVLAILQSSVSQFLFASKFNTVKVLKKHLQALPIYVFTDEINQQIELLVNDFISGKTYDYKSVLCKIDAIIYEAIGLNNEEIMLVESVYSKSS
jgi:hypothetical protein